MKNLKMEKIPNENPYGKVQIKMSKWRSHKKKILKWKKKIFTNGIRKKACIIFMKKKNKLVLPENS